MMRTTQRLRAGILVLILPLATTLSPSADAQTITVDQPVTTPVNTLMISDIDFLNSTTPKWLFTIGIRSEATVQVVMTIDVKAYLASGEDFRNPPAVSMETEPFTIDGYRAVTNLDLDKAIPVHRYTVRSDARRTLEETALPGGMVPAGMYLFVATVAPAGGGESATVSFSFNPTNPSSVELLYPFDSDEGVNEFPLFQWFYDGPRARLSVYEQLAGQSTPEEIISGVPQLSVTVVANSFQYPSAGVRSLQAGKSYAWFVEGLSDVAGGTEVGVKSVVRRFSVATGGAGFTQSILDELERALGPRYQGVFDRIRAEGLSPTGTFTLDGASISTGELLQLINRFRTNPSGISSAELE